MKRKNIGLAVFLALMMVVVFVPQMSFADEFTEDETLSVDFVEEGIGDGEALGDVKAFEDTGEADYTKKQIVTNQNLKEGVAVLPNGTIYALQPEANALLKVTPDGAVSVVSASIPLAYGANMCSTQDGQLIIRDKKYDRNDTLYVYNPSAGSYKTLHAGSSCLSVATDYDGNLYSVSTKDGGVIIYRAKASDVTALANGATIKWSQSYQPDYTAPSQNGKYYPQGIAVDGAGNIYIADKGSSNGHDCSVSGIFKYTPSTGKVTAMHFSEGNIKKFTWIYSVSADQFGNVAVLGRNSNAIAIFRNGSTVADKIITGIKGYAEDLAVDQGGNIYYSTYGQANDTSLNGLHMIVLNNISTTGVSLSSTSKSISIGKAFTLSAKVTPSDATNKDVVYTSANTKIATVSAAGQVTGKAAGKTTITVRTVQGKYTAKCTVTVNKLTNPLKVAGKTATVKYSAVKKKNQTLGVSKVINFRNKGQGTKTYVKKSGNKKITIAKSTGKVTVKKGLKKGTYSVKVKVTAAGNSKYKKITKTTTFKVKVK